MDPLTRSRTEGRVLVFGEVLFDRFPDGTSILGGAPFNVAWHLEGFGAEPLLISRLGSDEAGDRVVDAMEHWGLETSGIQRDQDHATGAVDVTLEGGEPSFEIAYGQAFDQIEWQDAFDRLRPVVSYFGTLACRHPVARATANRLMNHPDVPIFLDVNLRAPWWEPDRVRRQLERATELKLNEDELTILTTDTIDAPEAAGLEQRARNMLERASLERVYVTRGASGAVAFSRDGERRAVRPAATTAVVDTVGAGDAFSSVLLLGRLLGWPLATILERAQAFAGKIVGQRGATRADRGLYGDLSVEWKLK